MTFDQLLRRTALLAIALTIGFTGLAHADFVVTIDGTNSAVMEGETLEVTATIENTLWVGPETQTVTLNVAGSQRDSRTLTIEENSTQTVTFSWSTATGDAGDYTARVISNDDTASTSVTVLGPAHFDVQIDGTNAPVAEGQTLDVTATITNTGDMSGTQTVTLDVGASQRDSKSISLAAGAQATVVLSWTTGSGDAGNYTATVASSDESASTSVSVSAPAYFAVKIDGTNSPVTEGQSLDVTATISNTGDVSDTQTLTLDLGGSQRDSKSVTLSGRSNVTETFSWTTGSGDASNYTAAVASSDETATTSVSVNAPAYFAVQIDGTNSPVTQGQSLDVTATITNTGDVSDTQTITLDVGGAQRDSKSVTLSGGSNVTETFSWATSSGDGGDYTANLASNDDTDETPVSVDGPVPVEMTAFSATAERDAIRLRWSTASETNNAGFQIERRVADASTPGVRRPARSNGNRNTETGSDDWTDIGFVNGHGTTQSPETYQFEDSKLPYGADSLVYRLKQMDRDGSVNVTDPITVRRAAVNSVQLNNAFPNPVERRVTVQFAVPENTSPGTLRLYDLLGRQVRTLTTTADPGFHERQMDVSDLTPGTYVLRLTAGGASRTQQLTVVQ